MEVPAGSETFNFPNPQPPPSTMPVSSNSRRSSNGSYMASRFSRRQGASNLIYSPPEHIEPRGSGYQFSYTPLQRGLSSDSSTSESDAIEESDSEDSGSDLSAPDIEYQSAPSVSARRPSMHVRPIDEERDFTVEEISEDDIGYDDAEVVQPDNFEDAESERCAAENSEIDHDLASGLQNLHCANHIMAREFDDIQYVRYLRKKKRWSRGGSHKRSHAESVGSDSDDGEDIEVPDSLQVGSCARRLRRRTDGPDDRPRTSLLFDDPPKEIEELKYLDDHPIDTDTPNLNRETDFPSSDEGHEELHVTEVSDAEEGLTALPYWLYPMEIESDPSRPSSACGTKARRKA